MVYVQGSTQRQGHWSMIKLHEDYQASNTPRSTIKLQEDLFLLY
jgi:hypothetical protein